MWSGADGDAGCISLAAWWGWRVRAAHTDKGLHFPVISSQLWQRTTSASPLSVL